MLAFSVFLGIFSGRDPRELAEGTDKMRVVRKSRKLSGTLDAVALEEILPCFGDATLDDIFCHGKTRGGFEDATEIMFADVEGIGDLVKA